MKFSSGPSRDSLPGADDEGAACCNALLGGTYKYVHFRFCLSKAEIPYPTTPRRPRLQ